MEKAVAEWGSMSLEELEDIREDILDHIEDLVTEATPIFCVYTLEKLLGILGNILKHPHEAKYKTLKMENQVFYSNIGRFGTGISFLKFIGFETIRLPENNKLAYSYTGHVGKDGDLHPLMQVAYDEIKQELAKMKTGGGSSFAVPEMPAGGSEEQDRVECAFCLRKFARDRVDTHQFICSKIKQKPKRKVWDERKKRLEGTVFENYKPVFKNEFHSRFELCLSRRDMANMQKVVEGLRLTKEQYMKRAREFQLDNDLYFRCKACKEIMHQARTSKHECED